MGPHLDGVQALVWLKARYRLAVFINSDDALIANITVSTNIVDKP